MGMGRKQGESVSLSYSSATFPTAGAAVAIYDANGVLRPLLAWERLILDMMSFDTEAGDTTNLVYLVASPPTTAPTIPASGAAPASPIIAAFTVAQGLPDQGIVFPAEGESLAAGDVPWIVYSGSASGTIAVAGTGRVVTGGTQGVHPRWQQLLTPGGNPNGQ